MSFAIIISEKGGQERREVFDKNEISIGRVQGNDLLLPKGNVSKRHARIVYRDGRFIVTDLKSTNGSYVNGHRIAQATIVREGDKIYIGDFILKVDAGSSSSGPMPPSPRQQVDSDVPAVLQGNEGSVATPPPRMTIGASASEGSGVSHIPLEQDPDDQSATGMPAIPPMRGESRPPRVVTNTRSEASGAVERNARSTLNQGGGAPPPIPPPPVAARPLPQPPPIVHSPPVPPPPVQQPAAAVQASKSLRPKSSAPVAPGMGTALTGLLTRLADVVDLDEGDPYATASDTKRSSIERMLREQSRAMQNEGEIPAGVSIDELLRLAMREALGTGPLAELIEDEDVVEIQIARFDHVMVQRDSGGSTPIEIAFSSDAGLRRAVGRLALAAGYRLKEGDTHLDVQLPSGAHLTCILPPVAANGSVLVIRKRRRADLSLDDLVRSGTLSKGMAAFLQQCLTAKANVIVAGPLGAGTTTLIGALAAAGTVDERTIALQEIDEIILTQPYGASLLVPDTSAHGARIVRMASSLRPDRMLVGVMAGDIVGQVLEAIGGGLDGVIAAVRGPTLRQALARLVPALIAARPGLDPASARSWIASSFDVAVEVARLKGGRHRVLRIVEFAGSDDNEIKTRDVFEFTLDPAGAERGEGNFQACGVTPAVVQELKALGQRVDESIFRKNAR